ncbi:helix-turn-helix domain-containing protein [Bacteroidetes/Chlorobi group bacterium ChocPot_Mid]|jgi:transcriptional regulator with XRE-family HTH domain|nr:MAG: helix-turn-helix domain-containing protein [Bacteroidetes/Chlorobi group bacterium ChocPot_Mid]
METLGTRLRSEREKQKLSLEKVSELTKIRAHILKALENGNYSVVPPVYAKSFVINYANLLKIPYNEIEEEVDELFKSKLPEPVQFNITEPEVKPSRDWKSLFLKPNLIFENKERIVNYLIYITVTVALLLVFYYSFIYEPDFGVRDSDKKNEDTTAELIKPEGKGLFSFYNGGDSISLEVKAKDSAWMKITIDGKYSDQANMYPGYEKKWSASEYFMVTLGNAGAVEFRRNGEKLPPLGPFGTVVRNIRITSSEVVNSSYPYEKDSVKVAESRKRAKSKKPSINASKIIEKAEFEKTTDVKLFDTRTSGEGPSLFKKKEEKLKPIKPVPEHEETKPPN